MTERGLSEVCQRQDPALIRSFDDPFGRTPLGALHLSIARRHRVSGPPREIGDAQYECAATDVSDASAKFVAGLDGESSDFVAAVRVHLKPDIVLLAAGGPILFRADLLDGAVRIAVNAHPK